LKKVQLLEEPAEVICSQKAKIIVFDVDFFFFKKKVNFKRLEF